MPLDTLLKTARAEESARANAEEIEQAVEPQEDASAEVSESLRNPENTVINRASSHPLFRRPKIEQPRESYLIQTLPNQIVNATIAVGHFPTQGNPARPRGIHAPNVKNPITLHLSVEDPEWFIRHARTTGVMR